MLITTTESQKINKQVVEAMGFKVPNLADIGHRGVIYSRANGTPSYYDFVNDDDDCRVLLEKGITTAYVKGINHYYASVMTEGGAVSCTHKHQRMAVCLCYLKSRG